MAVMTYLKCGVIFIVIQCSTAQSIFGNNLASNFESTNSLTGNSVVTNNIEIDNVGTNNLGRNNGNLATGYSNFANLAETNGNQQQFRSLGSNIGSNVIGNSVVSNSIGASNVLNVGSNVFGNSATGITGLNLINANNQAVNNVGSTGGLNLITSNNLASNNFGNVNKAISVGNIASGNSISLGNRQTNSGVKTVQLVGNNAKGLGNSVTNIPLSGMTFGEVEYLDVPIIQPDYPEEYPVVGYVSFEGFVPVSGSVSVASNCGCDCAS